jgi:hypothetical protein
MATTGTLQKSLIILITVPKQGPIKGNQNLTIIKSGLKAFILKAERNQLNGLTEFSIVSIFRSFGAGPLSN